MTCAHADPHNTQNVLLFRGIFFGRTPPVFSSSIVLILRGVIQNVPRTKGSQSQEREISHVTFKATCFPRGPGQSVNNLVFAGKLVSSPMSPANMDYEQLDLPNLTSRHIAVLLLRAAFRGSAASQTPCHPMLSCGARFAYFEGPSPSSFSPLVLSDTGAVNHKPHS